MITKRVEPNPSGLEESVASTCRQCGEKIRYRRELIEKRNLDDAVQERIVKQCGCTKS